MWAESIVGLEITPRARAILRWILLPNPRLRRFISPRTLTPREPPLQSPPPPVPSPNRHLRPIHLTRSFLSTSQGDPELFPVNPALHRPPHLLPDAPPTPPPWTVSSGELHRRHTPR